MSIGSFLSREWKFAEAAGISYGAATLIKNTASIEALVDTTAPQTAAAIVAAVEKADSGVGPVASATINAALNSYAPQVEAELAVLGAQAGPLVVQVATALQKVAAKLQAEAEATV